jgi:hypothetical protein
VFGRLSLHGVLARPASEPLNGVIGVFFGVIRLTRQVRETVVDPTGGLEFRVRDVLDVGNETVLRWMGLRFDVRDDPNRIVGERGFPISELDVNSDEPFFPD